MKTPMLSGTELFCNIGIGYRKCIFTEQGREVTKPSSSVQRIKSQAQSGRAMSCDEKASEQFTRDRLTSYVAQFIPISIV